MDPGRTKTAKRYLVYADGACLGNPGPGGWGVAIVEPASEYRELSAVPVPNTTNNRMEITAAIEALRALEPGAEVTLRSDSEYVIKTMTLGWKRNVNRDLWEQLDREVAHRKVRFEWVPGHAGNHWNERADELARAGAQGKEPPAGAGAPPSKPPAAEAAPEETRLAQQIETMLGEGETIRKCAGCGLAFVADKTDETHCSLVACQLKARQKRRAAR